MAKIHAEWKQQQIKESLTRPQPRYALTTTSTSANLAVGESLGGTHIDHVTEETTRNTAPSISDIFGHAILAVPGLTMHATGSSSHNHSPALLSVPENRIRSGDGSLVSPAIVEEEDPTQSEAETEIKLLQRRASASSPTDLGNNNLLRSKYLYVILVKIGDQAYSRSIVL